MSIKGVGCLLIDNNPVIYKSNLNKIFDVNFIIIRFMITIGIIDAIMVYTKDKDSEIKNNGNFKKAKKNVKKDAQKPFFVGGIGEKGFIS